jgi:hypothetical protein
MQLTAPARFALTAVLFTVSIPASALEHTYQSWASGTEQVMVLPQLELWLDEHARRRSESSQFILRPAVGYRIAPGTTVHAGYAWIGTLEDATDTLGSEHRIWQQLIWSRALDSVALTLRGRVEQRFSDDGDEVGHRLRLFGRVNVTPNTESVLLALWNETFLQFNDTDWGLRSGFDQNRIFVGPGFNTQAGVRFEVGYLNVYQRGVQDQMSHVLAVNGFFTR